MRDDRHLRIETHNVSTPSGYPVPITWYTSRPVAPVLVFMCALGVAAGFYASVAAQLARTGFNVLVVEQRGQGSSSVRPSRRSDWGFSDILGNDIPGVFSWIRRSIGAQPLYLIGHSLGGHYAAMAAGLYPDRIDGLVLIATGSPWFKAYKRGMRRKVRLLVWLIPILNRLFGYYPGERIGFGSREARTVMADWRILAKHNRYHAPGMSDDPDSQIKRYAGPVLVIRFTGDEFAPEPAVAAISGKFKRARLTEKVFGAEKLNERPDHFRWARRSDAVVDVVGRWLRQTTDKSRG